MSNQDDFAKRLERINQSHGNSSQSAQRSTPTGVRGQKIGLVREREEEHPKKGKAIFVRLLVLLIVGIFGVRVTLAAVSGYTPELLDARQAELWAGDPAEKAGAVALMVMGAADPFISDFLPTGDTTVLRETVAANGGSEATSSAQVADEIETDGSSTAEEPTDGDTEIAAAPVGATPQQDDRSNPVFQNFEDPTSDFFDTIRALIASTQSSSGLNPRDFGPTAVPDDWFLLQSDDLVSAADPYFAVKANWEENVPERAWVDIPYLGKFVNDSQGISEGAQTNHALFFNAAGQSLLVEIAFFQQPEDLAQLVADRERLAASSGEELFIRTSGGGFRFKSSADQNESLDEDLKQFETIIQNNIKVTALGAYLNAIEVRSLLSELPLNGLKGLQF
ncbi:MAG: hypothetical protein AAF826_03685 [Pseudomonadota bacterium]